MKNSLFFWGGMVGVGFTLLFGFYNILSLLIGFCIGGFAGALVYASITMKQNMLKQGFGKLGDLRGKTLDEITSVVGPYNEMKPCTITDRDNAPGFFYTWCERNYLVTLLFDADKICIGVSREINGD
ncbi:MAG: hypothetical protein LUI08_07765 [Prevotella sp.]|nr:hypothetical protein [Prevotella sp.]